MDDSLNNNTDSQKKDKKPRHRNTHELKKRPTSKPYQRPNDIYITSKSNFKAQLKQCENILNSGVKDIYLHCLGNAISRGINLALTLVNNSNGVLVYEANTSTIELIDELHPLSDQDDLTLQRRMNSALHIRVSRSSDFDVDI